MKKVMTLLKVAFVIFTLFVLITVGTFAYYEYYGKYSSVINIDGTIKLDAFDVLYPELREDHTYGVTPENPYVIDNVARLQNLIQLNNAGKLRRYKAKENIEKFYFCLEFDAQDIPQVLNLLNEGLFDSIGNNDYPFEDELAGIVYGYELTEGNIVYLSGCLPKVEIEVVDNNVLVNGVIDTSVNAADYTNGTYLKMDHMYDASSFNPNDPESIVFDTNSTTTYIKLEDVTPIHQVIANETIVASVDQIDIGFVSKIASNGYVHDLILYNTSISCYEEVEKEANSALKTLFETLTGHHFADADYHSDEKHIGIFAGHIDGAASNISVAGTSNINIDTEEVNYYSNYMTVGYIYDLAVIGGVTFSELSQDSFLDGGSVSGCLFADDIYASVASDAEATTADGATHYALVNISQNTEHHWPGVSSGKFSYGSFVFLLSSQSDTVSKIWSGDNAYKLLNDQNYTITGSVLFCADEYRYSPDQQAGGSIIPSSASVREMLFSGISSLKATGSVIDAGKYLIVAKVEDATRDGGYAYYAIKLKASDDGAGNPVYAMDSTFSADVTNFILDDTGTVSLYQSALWNVETASTTPEFENCRYEDVWLTRNTTTLSYGTYSANSCKLQYSAGNNHLYFNETVDDGENEVTNQYYVAFDESTHEWSMTSNVNNAATIEMYHVADGYYLNLVTSLADIEANGDYVIVARNSDNGNSYLLGVDYTDGVTSNKFASIDKSYVTDEFPAFLELSAYEAIRNYVWNVQSKNGAIVSFLDKASLTYFLSTNNGALDLSTSEANWTYNQLENGGSLANTDNDTTKYLSFSYNAQATTTNFTTANSAYSLYLYRLIPQDDTPLYITYEGAKYLDADASTIDAGTYAIIAKNGNNYYALGLNGNAVASTSATTSVSDVSSLTTAYQWTVAEQTSTPTFRNVATTARFLNHSGTTLNSATTSVTWMYDAQEHQVYYKNGATTYYLVTDSDGEFSLLDEEEVSGYSYEVSLYKCVTRHEFTGVSIATSFNTTGYYLVSYADLSDTTKSQFLVGYTMINSSPALDSYDLSGKYTLSEPAITINNSVTITTTADMLDYVWQYSTASNNGNTYGYLNNYGYSLTYPNASKIYLGASKDYSARALIVTTTRQGGISGPNENTGIRTNTYTDSTIYPGARFGFAGASNTYMLRSAQVEGTFALVQNVGTDTNFSDADYADGDNGKEEYKHTYVYHATGLSNDPVLELVSSNGDPLTQSVHYMIVAEDGPSDAKQYYALSMELDDNSNPLFKGENVTSQVQMIMGYGAAGYKGSTNVPTNADWTQKSDNNELRFYHTASSSNSEQNYISRSGTSLIMDLRQSTETIEETQERVGVSKFYYDIVNKTMTIDVDSTSYYLTYDSSTKTFGISTNPGSKATIHLIRYTPTYKVEVITNTDDDSLRDGTFIVAGRSVNGFIAVGNNGSSLDYGFNITNYLNEDLAEEDYNAILKYIFKQVYYEYNQDAVYSDDVTSGHVEFQLLSINAPGSFSPLNGNFTNYSAAYKWQLTKTEDGTWKFVNNQKDGQTTVGRYGITFNNGGGSSSLKLNDLVPVTGSFIGEFDITTSFDNVSSNIYIYSPTTGERYTQAITSGANYLIVAEASGYKFVLGNNNGTVIVTKESNLTTLANDAKYLWNVSSFDDGYSITNNGYYAYVNASGSVLVQNSSLQGYFTLTGGKLAYVPFTDYYLYSNGATTVTVNTSENYWTKICRYSTNGTNYIFTPVTTAQINDGASNLVLISCNNGTYYLLNIGGTSISRVQVTKNGNDYQVAQTNVNISQYIVEVSNTGTNQYSIRSRNLMTMYSTNNTNYDRTIEANRWVKIYRYEQNGNTYSFYPVTTDQFGDYSTKLVLVSRDGNNYYLHDIRTNTRARTALTNSDGVLTQTDVAISDYVVEVVSAGTGQYNIRANSISHMYAYTNNSFNVSTGTNYWTKIYRYTIDGTNYRFYPVDSSEFNDYSDKLVLISNSNSTYYVIRTNSTTIARAQVTPSTNGTFTLATTNDITQYLVNVTNNGNNNYTISGTQWTNTYRYGNNLGSTRTTASATYGTRLYTYTTRNGTTTYTPINNVSAMNSENLVLITRNNRNMWIVKIGTNGLTFTAVTRNNNNATSTNITPADYRVVVTAGEAGYSIRDYTTEKYLDMSANGGGVSNDPVYFGYDTTGGFYYSAGTPIYLRCDGTRVLQTNAATVSYTDAHGVYYAGGNGTYYYLRFNATNADTATGTQTVSYDNDYGVYYYTDYHYLRCTSTNRDATTTSTSVTYRDDKGVFYRVSNEYQPGYIVKAGFYSVANESAGSMVVVYKYANGTYTKLTDDFETGNQYVIFCKGEDNIYYMIGYSPTNDLIVLTEIGTELSGFENYVTDNNYINAVDGEIVFGCALQFASNINRYLSMNDDMIIAGTTKTCWGFDWDDIYTDQSRLYNVETTNIVRTLTVSGSRVVPQASGAETQLFRYTGSGTEADPFKVSTIANANLSNGTSYVIVVYQDGKYYIVTNNDGEIVPVSSGSGFPTTITSNMLWTYRSANCFTPYDDATKYLVTGKNGALTLYDSYVGYSWSYTYSNATTASFATTAPNAADTTPLYLFKVSMNDSLDAISDTYTTLKGKSAVAASLSVLSSSNYVITATYNGKVYALAMKNLQESTSLDITETFREASNGGYIRLFSSSVWDQVGTDYNLIFDSLGFRGDGVNLLSGSRDNLFADSPTVVHDDNMPDDTEPYLWTLYTYGEDNYVLGNYDSGFEDISFIYFDYNDLMFKVTQSEQLAKTNGNKVSIYQLGSEVGGEDRIDFQTFMIDMMSDGVTIKSYPLAAEEPENITTFTSPISNDGTITGVISGEYLIAAKVEDKYYALTFDYSGNIAMSDISLLFLGNFEKDEDNKYCISINTRYLWKQTGTPSYDSSTGVASGLTFVNYAKGTSLDLDGVTLSYGNGQLHSSTTYLSFSEATGFSLSSSASPVEIIVYSVGAGSVVVGDDSNELSYSYFSSALNTAAVDFSDFSFRKMQIPELVTYAKDIDGVLTSTAGWKLTASTYLETVTSSVYFGSGVDYSNNLSSFANQFSSMEASYDITDPETEEVTTYTVNYYAPNGVVAFVIPEASSEMPTFINIIASTQQDEEFSSDVARYLAIWKMANLEDNALTPITQDSTEGISASDYAQTLINKFYKPDNAIPLPNHTGSVASGASYVKIEEEGENQYSTYNLSVDANFNHLIAHTFCITSPGLYYIGSTYGTVAISYLSISNLIAEDDGEVNEEMIDPGFSIDFVWGEIPTSGSNLDFSDDEGIGDLVYVGRVTRNDESKTWVHSNIYPKFVNGTAGLYEGEEPVGYNPTDNLTVSVRRSYAVVESVGISTVHINAQTTLAIDNDGNGIIYSNMNNAYQRIKRKVELVVTHFGEEQEEPSGD